MANENIRLGASSVGGGTSLSLKGCVSPVSEGSEHRRLLEALRAGRMVSFEWDLASDVVVRSANADELFGPEAEGDTGHGFFSRVHASDREKMEKAIRLLTPLKPDYAATFRYTRPSDGKELVLEDTGRAEFNTSGKLIRLRGLARDVTEQSRAKASEERLRTLLDHNPSLVFMKDEAGRYVYLNEAYEKQFVHSKDWLGKTDFDFWPSESAELFRKDDAEVLRCGQTKQFLEDSRDLEGTRHCWLCYKFPFTASDGGRYVGGVGIDATRQIEAEEKLRDSEELFRVMFTDSGVGKAQADPATGRFLRVNRALCRITGYSEAELLERSFYEITHPEDQAQDQERFRKLVTGEKNGYTCEKRYVKRDGTVVWTEVTVNLVSSKEGLPLRSFAVIQDVTPRKLAEERLRESEGRYRDLVEQMVDGLFVASPEGRYLDVNPAGCALLGMTRDEVLRSTFLDVLAPEEYRRLPETIASFVDGKVHRSEWRFRRKDGSVFTGEVAGRQLADGRLQGVLRDVTEQKKAEEAIRESEARARAAEAARRERQRFEDMLDALPVIIDVIRADHRIEWCNRAYRQALGDNKGRLCFQSQFGRTEPCEECEAFLPLKTGEPHHWEWTLPNGRTFDIHNFPFSAADGSPAVLEMDIDITERRKAEKALKEAKEELELRVVERTSELQRERDNLWTAIEERKRAEEAVRERTEELQTILDTTPLAVFLAHDPECRRITGNPAAQRLVKLPPEANISKSAPVEERPTKWQEMRGGVPIQPDDLPLQRAARGEEIKDYEMDLVFEDGTVKSVVGFATPIQGEDGNPRGGVAVLMDVTERKRAQEALRQSEERARLALAAGEMGTWDRVMPDGPAVWNEDHYRILGYEPGEVTPGKEAWEARVHPADLRIFYEHIALTLREGGDFDEELRIVWPSGEVRWVEMRGSIRCDAKGQPRRSYGVVVDFTERKRADEALRITGERLKQAIAVAGFGTFEHDHVTGKVEYSPVLRELMGITTGEKVTLASIMERVAAEDREAMVEAVRRAHDPAGDGRFAVDHRATNTDGRVRWISVRSQTFFEGEGSERRAVRTIGAALDITARKEAEAELQRLVAERTAKLQELVGELEHFSYTITHDLKSPLRAMRGFAEMASIVCEENGGKEAKEFLGRISSAAERMDHLIADALNYSRSVRQELPLEDIDSGALLRGMLDSYPEFQPHKAKIRVEGRLPVVLANEAGLTQCFSNLLGNAVKFVKPGQVPEICVRATRRKGWVRIWVQDHGIGIMKEMLPRVFDMFSRAGKDYEGTGIGLALVRKVVQRMGGKVGVESEEGKGSSFWIELKSGERETPFAESPACQNEASAASGGTVLYVEDEESDSMFMERAFAGKGLGGKLQLVRDGRAAINYLSGSGQYCEREKYPVPSLVLLDLNLPQVPGFEVLEWMRNNPDYARTPVVIFSSSTREDDQVKARELGANEFVPKPSSGLKFAEVVDALRRNWLG